MDVTIKHIVWTWVILFVTIAGCKKEEPPGGGGGSVSYCNCKATNTPMTVVVSSAPKMIFVRLDSSSYGANNFYLYELDSTANGFVYAGTQTAVEQKIATKNWEVPSGYLWAAGRAGLDGLDPYVPVIGEEFIYPYLPWTGGTATWSSSNNIENDKTTCPSGNHNNYPLPYCNGLNGKHQLDHLAPLPQDGKWYLARMVMGYDVNNLFTTTNACYQRIFKFETGVYDQ